MYVSEDLLVKYSCSPESFNIAIETTNNLITTLTSYIHGHVTLTEGSPSLIKVAPKRVATHSRPAIGKKKVTKMYESESSSSIDDEEAQTTQGQS